MQYASLNKRQAPGYKVYRPLWRSLLRVEYLTKAEKAELAPHARKAVSHALYDALMTGILVRVRAAKDLLQHVSHIVIALQRILDRLDVAYTVLDDSEELSVASDAAAADAAAARTGTMAASDRSTGPVGRTPAAAAAAAAATSTSGRSGGSSRASGSEPAAKQSGGDKDGANVLDAALAMQAAATNPQVPFGCCARVLVRADVRQIRACTPNKPTTCASF